MNMDITLKRTGKGQPEFTKVKQLYRSAFPLEERAPFWFLSQRAGKKGVDFWALYHGDEWIGLAYVISYKSLSHLFYFAISDEQRGKGYGSGVLRALKEKYAGQKLFLAIEKLDSRAENYEERVRRKLFYLKNGMDELHCRLREIRMVYEVLGTGGAVSPDEYKQMMTQYLGGFLSRLIPMEIII